MTSRGRDAMIGLLVLGGLLLAARALAPPPRLGPPHPAEPCAIPVEEPAGVRCLTVAEAAARGLRAGDRAAGGRMAPTRIEALAATVDPNHADPRELEALPGVGPQLAARIVAARPFAAARDLLRVPGIGEKRLAAIGPRLAISP